MPFRSSLKPARRRWLLLAAPLLAAALIAANLLAFSDSAAARPLRGFSSCGDLLAHYQDEMRRVQTAQDRYYGLEEEAAEVAESGEQAGFAGGSADDAAAQSADAISATAPSDRGDVSDSGTNVQERGVDETDIFKTDGAYLYVLRPQMLVIAEITEDGPPVEVGRIAFDQGSQLQEMLIGDGKVLVARRLEGLMSPVRIRIADGSDWNAEQYRAQSELLEIDVSNPASPRFLRELSLDGDFVSARMVGDAVRVVINFWPDSILASPRSLDTDEEARDHNEAIIESSELAQWHPLFGLQDHVSGEHESGYALACERTYAPDPEASPVWTQGVSYMLSFDLSEGLAERGSVGVLSDHPTVYASLGSLYLATPSRDWRDTQIHRFDIGDPLEPAYFGSGAVRGQLLSQWSMSEHDGYLRVATTIQDRWPTVSNVFVLEAVREDGGSLEQVGLVSGLGVTEDIFAVRFAGDVGYVVTFRQIDPLYVLDLSDPTDPQAVGELKIPGFSRYLHPLSGGLLLGIGRDADPQTGWERGLQASLFDVSDPAKPRQLSVLPLGDDAQSLVEFDHKAFRYQNGVAWIPVGPADWHLWDQRHDGAFLGVRVSAEGLSHESTLRVHGRSLRALPLDGRIHLLGEEEIRTYDLEGGSDLGALDFSLEWDNRWLPLQPE